MRPNIQSLSRRARRFALAVALCASPVYAQTGGFPATAVSSVPADFQFAPSTPPSIVNATSAVNSSAVNSSAQRVPLGTTSVSPASATTPVNQSVNQHYTQQIAPNSAQDAPRRVWPQLPSLMGPAYPAAPSPAMPQIATPYHVPPQSAYNYAPPVQSRTNQPLAPGRPPSSMRLVSEPRTSDDLADLAIPDDSRRTNNQATGSQTTGAPVQHGVPPFAQPVPQAPQASREQLDLLAPSPLNSNEELYSNEELLPAPQSTGRGDASLGRDPVSSPQVAAPRQQPPSLDELAVPLDELAVPGLQSPATGAPVPNNMIGPTAQPAQIGAPNSGVAGAGATGADARAKEGEQKTIYPSFFFPPTEPVQQDPYGRPSQYFEESFLPAPISPIPADPYTEAEIYRGKFPVAVQRPWVEWWRPLYTGGIYPPANTFFGETNLMAPHFMVYGDHRTGVGVHQGANGPRRSFAKVLNLDMDLKLTATERFHAFMAPFDRGGDPTRVDFSDSDNIEYVNRTDIRLDTGFFEGDLGAILGGMQGVDSQFDLPFTVGLIPLIYQNGIWLEDALVGGAFAIPAKNSPLLGWSNFDATFFAASDQVTSDAFQGDNNAARLLGTAWFIDAYEGYIEADYAFVHDRVGGDRSYHNASIAFTRRYFTYISNSIRFISNSGQDLPSEQRTADGFLILLENSLISSQPNTFVPYANFFYGSGRPQSVARAGGSGGILRNTGITFESDGLTNYPTLDATANNAYGAAFGMNMLGNNFSHQLVLELAMLGVTGSPEFRTTPGDQYAAGVRYQRPLSHRWIFRADSMYGWCRNSEDIFGNRMEFRWKF